MNKLIDNLLKIHEKLSDIVAFVNIRTHVESLNEDNEHYKKMVENKDMLLRVLEGFSERPGVESIPLKADEPKTYISDEQCPECHWPVGEHFYKCSKYKEDKEKKFEADGIEKHIDTV